MNKEKILDNFLCLYKVFNNKNVVISKNLSKKDKEKLMNENCKLWNMDTSILTILKRFFQNIKQIQNFIIENKDNIIMRFDEYEDKKGKKRYHWVLNNHIITPSKTGNFVAESTMWQYVRVLNYFDLIIIDVVKEEKQFVEILEGRSKLSLSISIFNMMNFDDFNLWLTKDEIINYMCNGIVKDIYGYKNMTFSILSYLLFLLDTDEIILKEIKNDFKFSSNRSKDGVYVNDMNWRAKLLKIGKETYEKFSLFFLEKLEFKNNHYECLQTILNGIFNNLKYRGFNLYIANEYDKENIASINEFQQKILEEIEINKKIQNARSKLRTNILNDRNIKDNIYYSDIEPIDENVDFIHDCIDQQEAAHIWSVAEIKGNYLENDNFLEDLSNPNNGILMDHIYHDAFDRGWIRFDVNGKMVATSKWNEKYVDKDNNYIKYPLMKIKESVFNNKMKSFFEKKQ